MDKAIANAMEVNADCYEEGLGALEFFAEACRDGDELFYHQAASNVLETWLRNKQMLENAHMQLLVKIVEKCPEDFGGEEFLAAARRCAAKAEAEASLDDLC